MGEKLKAARVLRIQSCWIESKALVKSIKVCTPLDKSSGKLHSESSLTLAKSFECSSGFTVKWTLFPKHTRKLWYLVPPLAQENSLNISRSLEAALEAARDPTLFDK